MSSPRHTIAALVLAILCLGAAGAPAAADDDDAPSITDTPHITVTGAAATEVAPDVAEVRLGVTAQGPTAAEAWDEDARRVTAVIDAAKSAGIAPQAITTTGVNLFQETESVHRPDGTIVGEPRGFRASHELRIRLEALDRIGSLTQTLIGKGADAFQGVVFSVARPGPIEDKLRGDAMRDARHHAEVLAAAAGVRLGRLLRVDRPDRAVAVHPMIRSSQVGAATMQVEPGTQTMSAQVEATYAID